MGLDAANLDANVDYGNVSGHVVRVDVDLPRDVLYPSPVEGAVASGALLLSADEAEAFGQRLIWQAGEVKRLNEDRVTRIELLGQPPGHASDSNAVPDP